MIVRLFYIRHVFVVEILVLYFFGRLLFINCRRLVLCQISGHRVVVVVVVVVAVVLFVCSFARLFVCVCVCVCAALVHKLPWLTSAACIISLGFVAVFFWNSVRCHCHPHVWQSSLMQSIS